jgi:sulfopyruvate decarboxylase subunit alpha
MPCSERFLAALVREGYDFFTGVPCSLLRGVMRRFDAEPAYGYVSAVREDVAVGIAAGAWLAGRRPAVLLQNSGLGVCLNALVSLNLIYEIPALLVTSWRGQDGKDAPEHIIMGRITPDYFEQLGMPWRVLGSETLEDDLASLSATITARGVPGALVVPRGVLDASG